MNTYPSYKSSGVGWLGEIPEHWTQKKLKYAVRLVNEKAPDDHESDFQIALENIEGFTGRFLPTDSSYTSTGSLFKEGDVLFNKLRPYLNKVLLAPQDGEAVGDLLVFRPEDSVDSTFLFYRLLSRDFIAVVDGSTYGAKMPRASWDFIGEQRLPFPPLPEQQAIAAYLDRTTAQIDALIRKRRRLIALLREQRAAVIARAVTKGLRPDAEMKDSGVAWLGAVPKHWKVTKLKFVSRVQSGVTKGRSLKTAQTVSVPYLRVANVQDGYLDLSNVTEIEIRENELGRYRLQPGDVLMTEGGDFDKLGRGAVWSGQIDPCIHQNHVFAVRPSTEVESRWLNLITLTQYAKRYFIVCSVQSTNLASISQTNLKDLPLPLPPVEEQSRIIQHVDEKTRELERLIEQEISLIAKLQELRTALISEAVTGKVDVREEVPA